MKRLLTWLLAVTILLPVASTAQTFTFTTNTSPGFTVSTNPWGTGVGLTTPYFNTVYTSDGYYDGYGRYHKRHHKRHHRQRPPRHRHNGYRSGAAHHKAMKKARKAYRKEMDKQYRKKAQRHYRRHHHDDD